MTQVEDPQAESEVSFAQPFFSIQAFRGLNEALSHWGRQSALLCLPIQLLISSRNTVTHTQNNV